MTAYDLRNIDLRADKEIFGLLCCEILKLQPCGKRVSKRLIKKHADAHNRLNAHLNEDDVICVYTSFNKLPNGKPDTRNLGISANVVIVSQHEFNEMQEYYDETEEDDED